MTTALSSRQDNAQALELSQQATRILSSLSSATFFRIPILEYFRPESSDRWNECERLLLSCLRAGDDKSAFLCLERLTERFGAKNPRIMALRGVYREAVASDEQALQDVLHDYDASLAQDPSNLLIAKRRIALLRVLRRPDDAIDGLTELLEASPTDIEAWSELAVLYLSMSMYSQAVFCLEEILLVTPNAWNIHAWLGEVSFRAATQHTRDDYQGLESSLQRYCRSIELCDNYLRGFYGLKLSSDRLLQLARGSDMVPSDGKMGKISTSDIRKLNLLARTKLEEAVKISPSDSCDHAQQAAIKALLT